VKLLLDEVLTPTIARELVAHGHDVIAVAGDPAHEALSDPDVLALARSQQRAVVTNNVRDFRPLHTEAVTAGGPGHYGIIFLDGTYRRTKADTGRIITALETKLAEFPGIDDLALTGSQRSRRQPQCARQASQTRLFDRLLSRQEIARRHRHWHRDGCARSRIAGSARR
jgi:predicted nuclease of predicted toxin-antitoxin system